MTARCIVCGMIITYGRKGSKLKEIRHCGQPPEQMTMHEPTQAGMHYLGKQSKKVFYLHNYVFYEVKDEK